MDKKSRHRSICRLRSLCDKTAEEFSRITGIGYAQLVAVEQGRRELSQSDAELISAATGVDPAFNLNKNLTKILSVSGDPYTAESFTQWTQKELPLIREQLARLRENGQDVLEEVLSHNVLEILAAARVQGKDLAVARQVGSALNAILDRFNLRQSIASLKAFEISTNGHMVVSEDVGEGVGRAAKPTHSSARVVTAPGGGVGSIYVKTTQRAS